jgi:hypothetical protein
MGEGVRGVKGLAPRHQSSMSAASLKLICKEATRQKKQMRNAERTTGEHRSPLGRPQTLSEGQRQLLQVESCTLQLQVATRLLSLYRLPVVSCRCALPVACLGRRFRAAKGRRTLLPLGATSSSVRLAKFGSHLPRGFTGVFAAAQLLFFGVGRCVLGVQLRVLSLIFPRRMRPRHEVSSPHSSTPNLANASALAWPTATSSASAPPDQPPNPGSPCLPLTPVLVAALATTLILVHRAPPLLCSTVDCPARSNGTPTIERSPRARSTSQTCFADQTFIPATPPALAQACTAVSSAIGVPGTPQWKSQSCSPTPASERCGVEQAMLGQPSIGFCKSAAQPTPRSSQRSRVVRSFRSEDD